jgi:hypothetical protein
MEIARDKSLLTVGTSTNDIMEGTAISKYYQKLYLFHNVLPIEWKQISAKLLIDCLYLC